LATLPDFGRGGIEEDPCFWEVTRAVRREKLRLIGIWDRHEGSATKRFVVRVQVVREIWGIFEATAKAAVPESI